MTDTASTGCGSCATFLQSSYVLDYRLQVEEEADPKGFVTAYTYDERGRMTAKTTPA